MGGRDVGEVIATLDEVGVEAIVNLDGLWGDELERNLDRYDRAHPGRFITFCHVDLRAIGRPGFDADGSSTSLRRSRDAGARGLKVWKDVGLGSGTSSGALVLPDDERLAPVFAAAGELDLPVLIHTADPVAFWDPVDGSNERLEELLEKPEWSYRPRVPELRPADRVTRGARRRASGHDVHRRRTSAATPRTSPGSTACSRPTRTWSSTSRSAWPSSAGSRARPRALIREHSERVLFGTDPFPPPRGALPPLVPLPRVRRRVLLLLAACDGAPPQGRWAVSALNLPADVLERSTARTRSASSS